MADARRPDGRGRDPVGAVPAGGELPVWIGRPPAYLTGLVGRAQETAQLRTLLLDRAARLVTLTGPGGVGKTRLAVQVATELDAGFDEVAFVEFAPVRDHDRVAPRIAEALGVAESADRSAATRSSVPSARGSSCWSWTTSSTSSRPGRFWSICWSPVRASPCW